MDIQKSFLGSLRQKGYRLTRVRSAIAAVFLKNNAPLSAFDIQLSLARSKIKANKTTVYRELLFLKEQNIIHEIHFGDGASRYEMARNHHHHLVCMNCEKVIDVILEKDLAEQEKRIEKNSNFKIIRHSLEFFGLCPKCR